MEESAVTVDGRRHPLPDPFFVVATQNPSEQYGTFPLPEGQVDRFAVALTLGSLDAAAEHQVVREQLAGPTVDFLHPVVTRRAAGRDARRTPGPSTSPTTSSRHALALVRATREDPRVALGASPRAALALVRCAQARAVLAGRDFVLPDDVKTLAGPTLAHRLVLHGAGGRGVAELVVAELPRTDPRPRRHVTTGTERHLTAAIAGPVVVAAALGALAVLTGSTWLLLLAGAGVGLRRRRAC